MSAVHESQMLPAGWPRTMVVVTMLMMSVMASTDMTIVTVALPYMAGNLSATADNITWVVTMYTVSQAISVGICGHLSRMLGRKRLCEISVAGFVISSVMCALAQDLGQIVIARFLQGFFGGPLIPVAQAVLVDVFPPAERVKGITLWVLGVMVGPAAGPALGGWLAENLDWRWNFWVNVPVGITALLLIRRHVRAVPPEPVRTDWAGLALLFAFVVGFQIVLDRGNIEDWFWSPEIIALTVLGMAAGAAFVVRGWALGPANVINLHLLRDRNFALCSALITILAVLFLGLLVLTPEVFVDFFGWEVSTAGLVIGSYGLVGFIGSVIGGRITARFGIRPALALASLCMAYGWWRFSRLALGTGLLEAALPGMWVQFGILLVYGPLASQAFKNLRPKQRDEGAGLFNFLKTLGFSLGVSAVGTMMYRGMQANWQQYAGNLNYASPAMQRTLDSLGAETVTPEIGARLALLLQNQTQMLTFVQSAEVLCLLSLLCVPLALLLPRERSRRKLAAPVMPAAAR